MAETYKTLAEGQLASSESDIYTAPALTKCVGPCIRLFNTAATTETVKLYLKNATSRQVYQADITPAGWAYFDFGRVVLEAGYKITGFTTTATEVDYWLSGVEIT